MHTYTDEQLMAYADGELPAAEARAVAQAAEADRALARRIAQFAETRRLLRDAFAAKLDEPVPLRLRQAVAGAPAPAVALRQRKLLPWAPTALAASVAFAVGLSASLWLPVPGEPPLIAGLPDDTASLRIALETHASGQPRVVTVGGSVYEIVPTATLRAGAALCREFESSVERAAPAQMRGLACRGGDGRWEVIATAASVAHASTSQGYAPASGGQDLAASLEGAVRLTSAEEKHLIENGWQLTE